MNPALGILQNFAWTHPSGRSTRCLCVGRSEPAPSTWSHCLHTSSHRSSSQLRVLRTDSGTFWVLAGGDRSPCDSGQTEADQSELEPHNNEANGAWRVQGCSSVPDHEKKTPQSHILTFGDFWCPAAGLSCRLAFDCAGFRRSTQWQFDFRSVYQKSKTELKIESS